MSCLLATAGAGMSHDGANPSSSLVRGGAGPATPVGRQSQLTPAGLGELEVRDAGHVAERDGAEQEHDRYGMPSSRAITLKAGIATHRPRIKSSGSSMAQNRDQDGPAGRTESASSGVAAQLPRRLSASADLEPGSAVQIVSICPGSAASSMRL